MNVISIAGNVARDGEIRAVGQTGESVLQFSVADNMGKDKGAIFWSCSLYGRRAETLAMYIKKGASVTITGQVTQREYTDKTGQKKMAQDVRVNDLALQGGKRQEEAPQPKAKQAPQMLDDDSLIPF